MDGSQDIEFLSELARAMMSMADRPDLGSYPISRYTTVNPVRIARSLELEARLLFSNSKNPPTVSIYDDTSDGEVVFILDRYGRTPFFFAVTEKSLIRMHRKK